MGKPGKAKQWKQGGDEDKMIMKKIKKGEIKKHTTAKTVRTTWPDTFGMFSENVIRNHLNSVKRANGLYLADSESETGDTDDECAHNQEVPKKTETPSRSSEGIASGYAQYSHQNFPIVCEKFKDPVTEYEKVLVVVLLPSGANNVKAELCDDGITVTIKYDWPRTMYDIQDLFKKQLVAKQFHLYHPMVLCYKSGLENVRKKIDMAPESSIKVNLPMRVQTAVGSWKHWGIIRDDGTQVFFAELSGYVKEYIKKSADESVVFEK